MSKPVPPAPLTDQFTGKPLRRFWKLDIEVKPGEIVYLKRPRKPIPYDPFPKAKFWVWTGQYHGYGRGLNNETLFASLRGALRFAQATHRAGYRIVRRK